MNTNLKLKFYYDHVLGTTHTVRPSPFHKSITEDVIKRFITPENLSKDSKIIDLDCGPGYFLDEMKTLEYTNITGITLNRQDAAACQNNGHAVKLGDMNFLDDKDESVDMLFARHSLQRSAFPYITLLEYNRVLRQHGLLYIEVPGPNSDLNHEDNKNHYSVFDKKMWLSLLNRTGFEVTWYNYDFSITPSAEQDPLKEQYYIFVCKRRRSADIK